ncbi:MAG: hypothetical protein JW704_10670 [Anaerolineaceae bacterium]|nr:hypothetical protein [Anaerolineaceae bacterium]
MDSELYQAPVKFNIYLPPCYADQQTVRYPVLYLLHGQTYDHNQWIQLGLPKIADELITNQRIPPVIIVLPNDPDWRQPADSPFGRMLIQELIPHIDLHYRTLAEQKFRAVGGLSRGAAWAMHLGLTEWRLFSRIGLHSLPVFVNDLSHIPDWLDEIPLQAAPDIYIDIGDQDPELNIARTVERQLSERHFPHEWYLFIGVHDESYWSRHLEKYLLWYACEWTVKYYN